MCRLLVVLALCATGRPAFADEDSAQVLEFNRDRDAPILAAAGFAWLAGNLMQPAIVTSPSCDPCLAETVNGLDRSVAGRRDRGADLVSWGLVGTLLLAPLVADAIDVARSKGTRWAWLADFGVYLEALAIDGALNEVAKLAVRRPRPFLYGGEVTAEERAKPDSYLSFYSEHTSIAFTAAASWVTTFALRHRANRGAIAVLAAVALAAAGTTAALRVVAGKHFFTDVGVGALVGTAIGVTVPLLHARRSPAKLAVAPVEGGAMAVVTVVR